MPGPVVFAVGLVVGRVRPRTAMSTDPALLHWSGPIRIYVVRPGGVTRIIDLRPFHMVSGGESARLGPLSDDGRPGEMYLIWCPEIDVRLSAEVQDP